MCRSRHLAESDTRRLVGADRPSTVVGSERSRTDRTFRASDGDREAVIALLGEHTGAGRLTLAEFEERTAAATAARTLADLDQLLVDLPAVPTARPAAANDHRLERWLPWLLTAVICLTIWAATSIMADVVIYFWPFWVIVPWGIVLAAGGGRSPARRHHLAR